MPRSELRYGAFLSYSVRGVGEEEDLSRIWRDRLKRDRPFRDRDTSQFIAGRLAKRLAETPLDSILTPTCLLVPVPSSSLLQKDSLWVPSRLATAMLEEGIGGDVWPVLRRAQAVRAAHMSESRPTVTEHLESMAIDRPLEPWTEVVLVDDVVTTGTTLLACGRKIGSAWPEATVRGFAVMRAISKPEEFQKVFSPVVGAIHARGDRAWRRP